MKWGEGRLTRPEHNSQDYQSLKILYRRICIFSVSPHVYLDFPSVCPICLWEYYIKAALISSPSSLEKGEVVAEIPSQLCSAGLWQQRVELVKKVELMVLLIVFLFPCVCILLSARSVICKTLWTAHFSQEWMENWPELKGEKYWICSTRSP